jgi:hypothetical protein
MTVPVARYLIPITDGQAALRDCTLARPPVSSAPSATHSLGSNEPPKFKTAEHTHYTSMGWTNVSFPWIEHPVSGSP